MHLSDSLKESEF